MFLKDIEKLEKSTENLRKTKIEVENEIWKEIDKEIKYETEKLEEKLKNAQPQ
ncbi:MAG: hypothetical protein Q4B23_02105 [Helcococcus sp.]|nr:hypothetical protein [Helcococcus sp.]